ncbi:MAG: sulfatase [Vicinamibacterales bacterium]|nr:sulfatase [Vicinamibacterales bacterium]
MRTTSSLSIATVTLMFTVACGAAQEPVALRLVDLFQADLVTGSPPVETPPRTEWRFDGAMPDGDEFAETGGVEAGPGVGGLAVRDGRLVGRTTSDFPLLRVERTGDFGGQDQVHAVEVRMRASEGTNLMVQFSAAEKVEFPALQGAMQGSPFVMTTPIVAGDDLQTYTLTPLQTVAAAAARHLVVRPTDVEGAEFEIESLRVVFRQEHLASIPSGVGWQGLDEVYHEALVSRSPETLSFDVGLGSSPWLDLTLGTIDSLPVTFQVEVSRADGTDATRILTQTLTTPERWERRRLELEDFAGQSVRVALSLASDDDGAIGLWGSPVVRNADAYPEGVARLPSDSSAGSLDGRPRGVILIQVDTLRRDHLDVYGYERDTAPVLSRLAAEGATFRRATAQATWTKVSTPATMTSLYPLSHGVRDFADRLPAAAETLAEQYRAAGYATLAYSSVLFTGQFTNMHQGFEELHEAESADAVPSSKTAREYVDRLSEWLGSHRDVPFFVFLHVFDPHDPFEPREPYATIWADPAHKTEHEEQLETLREHIENPLLRQFGMPNRAAFDAADVDAEAFVSYDQDWYDGSIRGMDVELGRLVERLRTLGLDDDTLIVFMSDHGEEFLEHGSMFHGQTVYNELTQVPLVMRWPAAIPSGVVVDENVQLIDIMPTLLDLSGLPHPEGLQGRSLLPFVAPSGGAVAEWVARPSFSEKAPTAGGSSPPPADTESYAVIDEDWLLIHNQTRAEGTPEFELYDVATDPLNLDNVADGQTEVVEQLARELDRWQRIAEQARLPDDATAAAGLSPEQLERLRSLGYIR